MALNDSSARRFTVVSSHSMKGRVYIMVHGRSLSLPGPHDTVGGGVGHVGG